MAKKKELSNGESALNCLQALVLRVDKENPDAAALVEMKRALDDLPAIVEQFGNVQLILRNSIISGLCAQSAFRIEATNRHIDQMKSEFDYDSSNFTERLLIDEIIMRWIRLQQMENDHKRVTYESHPIELQLYYEKRLHLTQQRYLRSLETLAKVRKLLAEANSHDERARNARSSATLKTAQLRKSLGI
ncbi:MAG TPA: hypothetical protein VL325_06150 [Pyrinomonadaceae bacterium]|nr:hypothetical protein [Pyrinomonadaceae bacterium]